MTFECSAFENPLLSTLTTSSATSPRGRKSRAHPPGTGPTVRGARAMASTPADVKEDCPPPTPRWSTCPASARGEIKVQIEDETCCRHKRGEEVGRSRGRGRGGRSGECMDGGADRDGDEEAAAGAQEAQDRPSQGRLTGPRDQREDADVESGMWGWRCKSSVIKKENCVLRCLSPTCYSLVYESDPAEEGEKDYVRSMSTNSACASVGLPSKSFDVKLRFLPLTANSDQGGRNMMLQQFGGVNAIGFYKLCKVHQVM
ncbi:uncharacterized protein A4U43_C01F22830 [Asparagus officinalis]|uniref:Uncharacterized protein n=1 Tax=Asparagus officinalis TaxID=4686 RepID=A0A5P1FS81_ASPOF|nr:uncharacterized protein A4U43_C01F22830 [Asparagus officinalis]